MRDWDTMQAEEAAQQDVVDGIVRRVYREVDTVEDRAEMVAVMLRRMHGGRRQVGEGQVRDLVEGPVEEHTQDPVERRLLAMRVCAKLFGGLASEVEGEWLRASLLRREGAGGHAA